MVNSDKAILKLLLIYFFFSFAFAQANTSNKNNEEHAEIDRLNYQEVETDSDLNLLKKKEGEKNIDIPLLKENINQSIFLNSFEKKELQRALESFLNKEDYSIENYPANLLDNSEIVEKDKFYKEESFVYLKSILYLSPNNWVVWFNDKKITYEENSLEKEFFIQRINGSKITMLWILSASKWEFLSEKKLDNYPELQVSEDNKVYLSFNLFINQSYSLSDDRIYEGNYALQFTNKKEIPNDQKDNLNKEKNQIEKEER